MPATSSSTFHTLVSCLSETAATSHDVASNICRALGRGVTRSKRRAMQWTRKAAENGHAGACMLLAARMYMNLPYARHDRQIEEETGVTTSAGVT